jgi:hypothetical protein
MNPIHTHRPNFLKILQIFSSHLLLGLPSGLFLPGVPTKILYSFIISLMHATCPDVIILIIFNEQYDLNSIGGSFLVGNTAGG